MSSKSDNYQVLLKFGDHEYVTLKVYETSNLQSRNEIKVLQHLSSIASNHPGRKLVRLALDSFELQGRNGPHCTRASHSVLKPIVYGMRAGLDSLHPNVHVVRTDVQAGNIILSTGGDPSLPDGAWTHIGFSESLQGARRVCDSLQIQSCQRWQIGPIPIISDFGDAQFGESAFYADVVPDLYRAPELLLGIPWDNKIDIWPFGLMMWTLYEGENLLTRACRVGENHSPHIWPG
ncbi:hypothetical protein N657DRAFT_667391 [Parathielavia appendiculata]|uniref:Protein kinase domain-containing protein n=1 Tax=Parathielavia appendiculata TaxID=2587402 RepID=A0AAN6U7S4_9PEZI|nr:hypothetical protein N657DRAFT_667391 [Parathielavia appendiculata]